MDFDQQLDAEIAVYLTRADYDRTRKKFYAVTGLPRDDVNFPKLWPPGSIVIQSADGNPILDIAANPVDWEDVASQVQWYVACVARLPGPPWISEVMRVADRDPTDPERKECSDRGGSWTPRTPTTFDPIAQWLGLVNVSQGIEGGPVGAAGVTFQTRSYAKAMEDGYDRSYRPKVDPAILRVSDDWWYDTPWGQERVRFVPWIVMGRYAWNPAMYTELPSDGTPQGIFKTQRLVAVRYPHPYIVGLPEPERVITAGSWSYNNTKSPAQFGLFRSQFIITGDDQSHGRGQFPLWFGGDDGYWMGFYQAAKNEDVWEQTVSYVSRNAALQIVVGAALVMITAGAGASLLSAVVGAPGAVVGSATGIASGGLVSAGAAVVAGAGGGAIGTIVGSAVALTGAAVSAAGAAAAVAATATLTSALAHPAVAVSIVSATSPEQVNSVIADVARGAVYADLIPFVGPLMDMTFTELTVRAQTTEMKRDAMRVKLVEIHAEVTAQEWFGITKQAITIAVTVVIAVTAIAGAVAAAQSLAAGAAAPAGSAAAQAAAQGTMQGAMQAFTSTLQGLGAKILSAATVAANMFTSAETAKALKSQSELEARGQAGRIDAETAGVEADIVEIERQIAEMERQAAAEVAKPPVGSGPSTSPNGPAAPASQSIGTAGKVAVVGLLGLAGYYATKRRR
mgnify:CR=1 FL=1